MEDTMSTYGPQGGPYPGQPQDPWQDGPATDSYASGYPDPLTHSGFSAPQSYQSNAGPGVGQVPGPGVGQVPGAGPYGPGPAGPGPFGPHPAPGSVTNEVWAPPPPTGSQGKSGAAVGMIIIVVLLVIGAGGAAAFFLTRGDGKDPEVQPSPGASAEPSPSASQPNADAKVVKIGECLVNRGTTEKPDMQKVACAKDTYQVLKRIDGTSDRNKCEGTAGLTDWYFFDHADNAQDFVLCLRKR
jgi:hypothetical protein